MSRRALAAPIRQFSRPATKPWICRRCLNTETSPSEPTILSELTAVSPPSLTISSVTNNSSTTQDAKSRWVHSTKPLWFLRRFQVHDEMPEEERQRRQQLYYALKRGLPHRIPPQLLMYVQPTALTTVEKQEREHLLKWALPGHVNADLELKGGREVKGVVVSAGKMDRTVKVRVPGQRWEPRVKKYYASHTNHLVHDPNNSLVTGDVVQLHRLHVTEHVRHVVAKLLVPFGKPSDERPPIPLPEERLAEYKQYRFAKLRRRKLRRKAALGDAEAIRALEAQGLDPGDGVEAGKMTDGKYGQGENTGKGPIKGKKGQMLPHGVLPGGQRAVGRIDGRAKKNKESAIKMDEKAVQNLLEAKEKGDALEDKGLQTDSALDKA